MMPVLQELQRAGANVFTFHLEALGGGQRDAEGGWPRDDCVKDLARRVRLSGMAAGLALVPSTTAEAVEPYIAAGDIDLVRHLTSACSLPYPTSEHAPARVCITAWPQAR